MAESAKSEKLHTFKTNAEVLDAADISVEKQAFPTTEQLPQLDLHLSDVGQLGLPHPGLSASEIGFKNEEHGGRGQESSKQQDWFARGADILYTMATDPRNSWAPGQKMAGGVLAMTRFPNLLAKLFGRRPKTSLSTAHYNTTQVAKATEETASRINAPAVAHNTTQVAKATEETARTGKALIDALTIAGGKGRGLGIFWAATRLTKPTEIWEFVGYYMSVRDPKSVADMVSAIVKIEGHAAEVLVPGTNSATVYFAAQQGTGKIWLDAVAHFQGIALHRIGQFLDKVQSCPAPALEQLTKEATAQLNTPEHIAQYVAKLAARKHELPAGFLKDLEQIAEKKITNHWRDFGPSADAWIHALRQHFLGKGAGKLPSLGSDSKQLGNMGSTTNDVSVIP